MLEACLENSSVEHILYVIIKRIPVGFLCILGIQSIIGSGFFYLCNFKTQTLIYSLFSSINSSPLLLDLQ